MKHNLDWTTWIYGAVSALVGGGASAITAAVAAGAIDPKAFNLHSQLKETLSLMAITFILNGTLSVCFYLKQSPLPKEENETTS